jgi:hypothetical protein
MISRSGIPEAIVGAISLYMFVWIFPSAYHMQSIIPIYYDFTNQTSIPIILAGADTILTAMFHGLLGFFCLFLWIERCLMWVKEGEWR